jgi:hypothetical protein
MKILKKTHEFPQACLILTHTGTILYIMATRTTFFTKTLIQSLTAIKLMASPEGTTIEELVRRLLLTRRSVFRLLRTIEHDLHIPFIVKREVFGGHASYHVSSSCINRFSNIIIPKLALTFDQALLVYLLACPDIVLEDNAIHKSIIMLRDRVRSLYESPE